MRLMTREEIERRIANEGVDPQRKSELVDVVQYGNVLVTLWQQPASPYGLTSYIVKLEHSGDFTADGSPFVADDREAARDCLLWATEQVQGVFYLFQLVSLLDQEQ
jgi:hypothetical protein